MISDHLGTPLQAIDSEGKLIWERELDIYGRIRKEEGEKGFCNMLYQGQYLDTETELVYNYKRYYSQETGAYISQDPIGLAGGNPTIYGYVKDPNTWVDVFGLDCTIDDKKLQKKYKHANDFGISGPYNKQNAAAFKEAILLHVNDPDVIRISGTYRGEPVTHYYNANNGLNVIVDSNDNFVSGWKLSPAQEMHITTSGNLGGG
ncbi:RHS repeat domain-containing protein [Treponema pedis]